METTYIEIPCANADIFLNIIGVLIGYFLFFILKKPFLESQFSSSHIQR